MTFDEVKFSIEIVHKMTETELKIAKIFWIEALANSPQNTSSNTDYNPCPHDMRYPTDGSKPVCKLCGHSS